MKGKRLKSNRPAPMHANDRPRPLGARNYLPLTAAISAILGGVPAAHAQQGASDQSPAGSGLAEIVVTAQKRSENMQNVPVSLEVLDSQKLDRLHIVNLDDYVKYSPSVSYVRGQGQGGNGQPGSSHIYMRGVVSGGEGNHSGAQPSVGTYLDEQPVTTIDGTVDVHIYDIQRIEVLEGPQGTLFGASSEAGTVRIISNKPDPSKFAAGYDLSGNSVDHGGIGYTAEGFVNIPLSSIAAVRLVGWYEKDAGYIDNVAGTNASACIKNGVRTFPTWSGQPSTYPVAEPCPPAAPIGAGAISNAAYLKNNYNTAETKGGRAALKLDLGDHWTVTPTVMGQSLDANGFFGYDPGVGDLQLAHFGPENSQDSWMQGALTVEGKYSDFDLTYAGAFMKRDTHSIADYSDYSEFYDRAYGSGYYWQGNNGSPIMPQELVVSKGYFQKWSHELRLSTPQELPVKATVGLFAQRQLHNIWEQYVMPGFGFTNPYGGGNPNGFSDSLTIPTLKNTIWLTDEQRVDRDQAAFAQVTWDIDPHWSVSGGLRYFKYDNSLQGFYGYSYNYHLLSGYGSTPTAQPGIPQGSYNCQAAYQPEGTFVPPSTPFAPCTDLNNVVKGNGTVPRLNVTYKFSSNKMVYATYSKGFRPGGVNRTALAGIGPYQADYLKNYEIGWKTQWLNNRLRWNGAIFWEDWNDFQFSFLGPNSVTIIENGGNARIKGIENELEFRATDALTLSANFTFLDPVLTQNYCGSAGVTSCPNLVTPEPFGTPFIGPQAPAGTNLPVTPKFKGNLVARYEFDPVGGFEPFAQASWVYQTQTTPLLRVDNANEIGKQPAYGLLDLVGGMNRGNATVQVVVTNVTDKRAQLSRFVQCTVNICDQPYIIPAQPRTIAIKFGQKF